MSLISIKQWVSQESGKVSLRYMLIVPFVLQIFTAVTLVGWLSFKNGQKAVNELANHLQEEVGERISDQLDHYLAVPRQVNEFNLDAIKLGTLDINNLNKTMRYFWKQIKVYDNLSFINFGSPKGAYVGVGREDDGTIYMELMNVADRGRYQRYALDNAGNPTLIIASEEYPFQEDEWYADAVQAGQPIWSQIYQWSDRPDIISISSSYPVYNTKNQLIGVIGIDLILSQISDFLKSLTISPSAKVFIIEPDGLIVASSSQEKPYIIVNGEAKRLSAFQSQDPLIQATSKHLMQRFSRLSDIQTAKLFDFKLDGNHMVAQVTPWRDELGLNWLIVVAIPESDFMNEINANTHRTILLCFVALAIATAVGILIARQLTAPILQVNQASQKMANGDLNQHVEAQGIIELEELAVSFNRMASQLQDSFETLEEKVQERTLQLATANRAISELNQQLKLENNRMSSELDVLREMQQLILPKPEELAAIEDLEIAGFMEPAAEVGGDYYDVLYTNGVVTIGIGDVTGHGLESGILMVMTQAIVRTLQEIREHEPVRFLDILNRAIYHNVKRMNSDKNLTLAILNYTQGRISISGQHEETIVMRAGGNFERINTMDLGLPIGIDEDISDFINHTIIHLNPGDGLVLYTDGITEARNINKKQYGLERLCEIVSQNWHKSAEAIKNEVINDVREFMGKQKQFDDITLLILKQK